MRKLSVAVGGLIEIHEVHVDQAPWEIAVELRMEMEEWLREGLKSGDPHSGRREGVHPGDHADALVGRARLDAGGENRLRVLDNRLPHHANWKGVGLV